jgi:hypothetical protein
VKQDMCQKKKWTILPQHPGEML